LTSSVNRRDRFASAAIFVKHRFFFSLVSSAFIGPAYIAASYLAGKRSGLRAVRSINSAVSF
jgi:hypothetical protein